MKELELNKEHGHELIFSNHALVRMQQRGLTKDVISFIFNYGIKMVTHQDHRYIFNTKKQKGNKKEAFSTNRFE